MDTTELLAVPRNALANLPATRAIQARWQVSASQAMAVTQDLPEEERASLLWLDDYARKHNLSRAEVAALIPKPDGRGHYDEHTIYAAFKGIRAGSLKNFVAGIQAFKADSERHLVSAGFPYVKTAQGAKIWAYCDAAQSYHKMGLIYGMEQQGKSADLVEYQRSRPHKQVIYVEMPKNGYCDRFTGKLARALGISPDYKTAKREDLIFGSFDSSMMLIVDEVHRCFRSSRKNQRLDTLDFLRELYNETKCSVILCGTHEAQERIESTTDHVRFMAQIRMRGLAPLVLKGRTVADLNKFAAQIGLPPAEGDALTLQKGMIQTKALGYWLMHLEAAKRIADKAGRQPTWNDVLKADQVFRKLSESGEGE